MIFMFILRFGGALARLFRSSNQSTFRVISVVISFYFILLGLWRLGHVVAQATTTFTSRVLTRVRRIHSPACRFRRTGSRSTIIKRFRRRRLHVCLVKRCRGRLWDASLLGPRIRQHRHWRRRKARWVKRIKVKRRDAFLRVVPSATKLWNRHRKADAEFLGANIGSFKPFFDHGMVPEEVLDSFVVD